LSFPKKIKKISFFTHFFASLKNNCHPRQQGGVAVALRIKQPCRVQSGKSLWKEINQRRNLGTGKIA
jgi:hypothetical protein